MRGAARVGTLHHISQALDRTLGEGGRRGAKVVYYTSLEANDVTNAIFLLGAYLVVRLGATVEETWKPFVHMPSKWCVPFRDATWVASPYDLHVKDCWAGLHRAMAQGLYDPAKFDKNEYFYYDNPDHGDLHQVVPGKFIAFRGPRDDDQVVGALRPDDYIEVFACVWMGEGGGSYRVFACMRRLMYKYIYLSTYIFSSHTPHYMHTRTGFPGSWRPHGGSSQRANIQKESVQAIGVHAPRSCVRRLLRATQRRGGLFPEAGGRARRRAGHGRSLLGRPGPHRHLDSLVLDEAPRVHCE